ncbi:hypothetical protein KI688_000172 [Linnemannia hyalina]|uniref:Membrane anchor Opy2 N-terminal domain-containing protein n=1 Tax=Linnemannia hyalina TaxID=64524 RepID=A0A9P8BZV2_9FUNG|nr:hypothetical protein KI688_000172 [Linnemannia hyalina]
MVCSPSCSTGFNCRADVIGSICQCPSASCVKINFDIGAGNGDDDSSDSKPSLIGPIIGAIAGLAAIACIAFFVIRKRKQKRRRSSVLMLGQDDSNDSFSKRWNPSTGSEFAGHKDVIRIAYIPSMIGDSPASRPVSTATALASPQPQFASLRGEDRNNRDSVGSAGSHMSAVLDEAVVMAVTTKATPQVMNFTAIKAAQSDLIQRSNTLHSTNSIKRSTSQRRIADAKNTTNTPATGGHRTPSPLSGGGSSGNTHVLSDSDDNNSDAEGSTATSVTQTAHMRRRSAGKQNLMDSTHNPFMSPTELLATGSALPSPSGSSMSGHNGDTLVSHKGSSTYRNSNPFMSQSESATLIPELSPNTNTFSTNNRFSTLSSSTSAPSPVLSSSSTFASIPIRLGGDIVDDGTNDPLSPFADLAGGSNLRPWMSSGTPALRDSTFSTMSDARSSTRGDGEEIMIFWGGQHNRDSKASNV